MGFSVIEKGIGYSGEYIYKKSSGTGRTESVSAKSYFRQLQESSGEKANSTGQASVMELYERMRRFRTMTEIEIPETKTSEEASEPETASCLSEEQEDSRTDTEIIVKPDGSRVLVVTMNVGGTETSMTLKISEPTAMPNDNRTAETAAELPQPQTESES